MKTKIHSIIDFLISTINYDPSRIFIQDILSFIARPFGLWLGIISIVTGIYALYLGKVNHIDGLKVLAVIAILTGLFYLGVHFYGIHIETCYNSDGCYQ